MVSQPALTAVTTAAGSQAVPVRLINSMLTSPHTLRSQLASLACCLRPSAHSLSSSRRAGSLLLRAQIQHACRMHISYQQAVASSLFSSKFPKKLMLGGCRRICSLSVEEHTHLLSSQSQGPQVRKNWQPARSGCKSVRLQLHCTSVDITAREQWTVATFKRA